MTNIQQALQASRDKLQPVSESWRLDSEVLLAHVLKKSRTFLYTYPETLLEPSLLMRYQSLIYRRQQGLPIAYLIGEREFWSLPLRVNEHTLIPRPETECLVRRALKQVDDTPKRVLDLGTGSGAIALALAYERPSWHITAVDSSKEAIRIAEENKARLQLNNVTFYLSHWFDALCQKQPFDLIVSNPPYIAEQDPHLQQGDVRFEPQQALVSGQLGLDAIEHIISESLDWLTDDGLLLLEHGWQQKKWVVPLLEKAGFSFVQTWPDDNGHDRVSGGRKIKNTG